MADFRINRFGNKIVRLQIPIREKMLRVYGLLGKSTFGKKCIRRFQFGKKAFGKKGFGFTEFRKKYIREKRRVP